MIELIKINKKYEDPLSNKDLEKFIVSSKNINRQVKDFLEGKIKVGYETSFEDFDKYFVFKENEYYIKTGKKGVGKTTISQIIQLMGSISNGLIWLICFKENSEWNSKLNYMNWLIGGSAKECYVNNRQKYKTIEEWVDEHFIFADVDSVKEIIDLGKYLIEEKNIKLHAIVIDPINSFSNGWQDTGNDYADGKVMAIKLLKFTKKHCSIHVSQHPTMSGQRQEGRINSYQGEGGWHLNKASFSYVIHRENGSNLTEILVEHVRNKFTGGAVSDFDNPICLEWSPYKIGLQYLNGDGRIDNIINKLIIKNKPFDYIGFDEEMQKADKDSFFEELPKINTGLAF